MKTIDLLMLQGTPKQKKIQLFGVFKGNSGDSYIEAYFDGDAYIKDLTTNEKTYLVSGEQILWEVPSNEARNYEIVGEFQSLALTLNTTGPNDNNIQEISFNNVRCDSFTYNAFSSNTYGVVPHITGNAKVKNMYLTIFGQGATTTSQYIAGTFFTSLNQCNSSGTLKMESGFVTPDNIAAASSKYYTLSALS